MFCQIILIKCKKFTWSGHTGTDDDGLQPVGNCYTYFLLHSRSRSYKFLQNYDLQTYNLGRYH